MSNAALNAHVRVDPAARRLRKSLVTPTLLRVLALLALAVLVFGAYVATWVSSRDAYFTTRNFRTLAGLGKQIKSILAVQSDGLRYGALGVEVEEPVRQETELSISYPDAQERESRRIRLASGFSAPAKEARPDRRRGRPLLGFEAYPEGSYLETAGVKNPRKLSLGPLIEPVLSRDVFDHVLVADSNGSVLFEEENREIRLASLSGLVDGKAGAAGLLQGRQSTARIRAVDLSGSRYDIFVSPLRVPVAREKENEGAGPWLVCGLVRSEVFRSESLALPLAPLIGFVVLLILILLSWPLIKLRSIEGWEHLSRLDLVWLAASMFLIPALLGLTIWGGWRFHGLFGLWNQTLRQVADRIAENLEQDVRAYEELLEAADGDFSHRENGGGPALASRGALTRLPFNDVFWIGRDGCQALKVSFGPSKTVIDVSDREYFHALARDVHPGSVAWRRRAFVESVNSWTTGEPELVIALRRPRDPDIPVVAVATPLPSLIDTVLPPGFEYAVVQNRREVQRRRDNPQTIEPGEVLLHSDKRRNLRENLLQEVTEPSWLGAAVKGRETGWGTIVYQGKYRLGYTRPLSIEDRPWSLVVLADSDMLTGLCLQVATTAFALTALYGLAVGLLFFLYSRLRGAGGSHWLWPQRHRLPDYTALVALLLALVLVYAFVLLALGAAQSLIFAALFPLAVLGGLHETLGRPVDEPRRNLRIVLALEVLFLAGLAVLRTRMPTAVMVPWLLAAVALAGLVAAGPEISGVFDRWLADRWRAQGPHGRWAVERPRQRYVFCLMLGAVLLAVLPTVSFVNLAFDSQMEGLIQRTQLDLAGNLEEREKRLAKELGERFPATPRAAAEEAVATAETWQPLDRGELTADGERCVGFSESYPALGFGLAGANREEVLAGWLERRLEFDRGRDYASLLFDTCVCYEGWAARGKPSRTCSCREPSRVRAANRTGGCAHPRSSPWLPPSATSPAALRFGEPQRPEVSRSRRIGEEEGGCYELPVADGATGERTMTIITRPPVRAVRLSSFAQVVVLASAVALAAVLLFLLIRFVTSLIFFQGAAEAAPAGGGRPLVHLALDRSGLPSLSPPGPGWRLLDLREAAAGALDPRSAVRDEDQVVVVDHFDLSGEAAATARDKLLRETHGRRLVLLCDRPSRSPSEPGVPAASLLVRDGDSLRPALDPEELARKVREDAFLIAEVEELERWLLYNCGDLRQVIDTLGDALRPVYEARWSALEPSGEAGRERSQEEKLILHALVRGRLVTAKAGRRLKHLAAEGFITQDPQVRIVSASQRIFIRNQAAREAPAALAALDANSLWSQLKTPMAIGVVLLLAFLFFTQRDLFNNAIAQVATIGGGLAALLQFLADRRNAGTRSDGA